MSNEANTNTNDAEVLTDQKIAEMVNNTLREEINKRIREGTLETVTAQTVGGEPNKCVFCGTTDPEMHVKFCGICKKWMCDTCRKKYGDRIRAAANEHFPAVTQTAEAIKERAKRLFAMRQQQQQQQHHHHQQQQRSQQ